MFPIISNEKKFSLLHIDDGEEYVMEFKGIAKTVNPFTQQLL